LPFPKWSGDRQRKKRNEKYTWHDISRHHHDRESGIIFTQGHFLKEGQAAFLVERFAMEKEALAH